MADWSDLDRELNRWEAAGLVPTFWWRDDDAERPCPALDRLLALSQSHGLPLHLAVVPAGAGPELSERLARERDVFALQHGLAHLNHEPRGLGASEIGDNREITRQLDDLRDGWQRLNAAEIPNLLAALAPPWNRIAAGTVGHLAGLGYKALSTSHPRAHRMPAEGLMQVNIHVDPIRWKDGAGFRGTARILDAICQHLADRRLGRVDSGEPTGILTHHLQTDEEVWDFLDAFFDHLPRGRVDWVRLSDLIDAA